MLGAALALASAAAFGFNNATVRRGVLTATVLQGMAVTVSLGVPIFAAFALIFDGFGALARMGNTAIAWMAAAGVIHFVIGRYGNYRATQALGANLSTPVQQLAILVSLVLALAFLAESITGLKLIGLALVLFGPFVVLRRKKAAKAEARGKVFEPKYGEGFLWGAVCALGYGTSPLFIAIALQQGGGIPASVAGGLISYATATVVVIGIVMLAGGRAYMANFDRTAQFWFVVSSFFVALSQMFRYMALAVAPVTVVVPIQRLSAVFRIIFGALMNRDSEIFDRWIIVGIVLSVFGAVALTLSTEIARAWIGPSPWLDGVLFWEWRPGAG